MKIGDMVRIKSWNELRAEANYNGDLTLKGGSGFCEDMEVLCGDVIKVKHIEKWYKLVIIDNDYNGFYISTEMVEEL